MPWEWCVALLIASAHELRGQTAAGSGAESVGLTEVQRGAALAQQYCSACHLFPEPSLLDKKTWINGALRKMAPYLGVARIRYAGRPDGARLEASHLFPPAPWLTETEWNAIRHYYAQEAPETAHPSPARDPIGMTLPGFSVERLGNVRTPPLTTFVKVDGAKREILLGDAGLGVLSRFGSGGRWLGETPVRGATVGLCLDGGRTFATLIGEVFPSDVPSGKLVVLPDIGSEGAPKEVLTGLQRPTCTVVSDFNGDGRNDFLICSFGNYLGRLSWFEQLPNGQFDEHVLLDTPGALKAEVLDVNGDGSMDFFVLMAQGNEGLFLFTNQGNGDFSVRPLLRFHPAFGSTGFELVDMNGDRFPDVLLTNGDNGEYPSPFKNYHGVRIYLNNGHYQFTEALFYPLNGAFKAVARDFDGDGDVDVAAISFFADYSRPEETGFVYLQQQGAMQFTAQTVAEARLGRWLTMDAGDVDGNGSLDLVLGSFAQGPPGIEIPSALQVAWRTNGVSGLLMRNLVIPSKKP